MNHEKKNILNNTAGEKPVQGYLIFKVNTKDANKRLQLIKDVILSVCEFREDEWPEDQMWDKILPRWFYQKIKNNSIQQIKSNPHLWDYGSWLDAMKYRGWKWFSSKVDADFFEIVLDPNTFPFSVDPLEYVILETDINLADITFEEHME